MNNIENKNVVIFVEWLEQGREYESTFDIPFVCGETPHYERERIFDSMKEGNLDSMIISRVGDEGIDIPNADLCIICSTLGSSSTQTAQ